MKPTRRLLAPLPVLVIGLAAMGGAFAPAALAAGNGTWTTPAANATVSGSAVSLQFATSDAAVTFTLPSGNGTVTETATVSGGVATGTFDSTKVTNGTAQLVANECNLLNVCDSVPDSVTVSNQSAAPMPAPAPSPTPMAPTFSPAAGATIAPGQTVTVSGSGLANVGVSVDGLSVSNARQTLPYTVALPTGYAQGQHGVVVGVTPEDANGQPSSAPFTSAVYNLVVPDTTPPVISKLVYPTTYFPVRDGYLDHFYAIFSVNEASTATLVMSQAGRVVSSGTLPIRNTTAVDVRAGDRLKAGSYQWQLLVTDTAGNVTKTPLRTVKADPRHLIEHRATLNITGAASPGKTFANGCGSFRKTGGALVISSGKCVTDVAAANFFPALKSAVDYSGVTVTLHSTGVGGVTYINFATGGFARVGALRSGTTTLKLTDLNIGYPRPEFIIEVIAAPGKTVTVSSISAVYTYGTLSK